MKADDDLELREFLEPHWYRVVAEDDHGGGARLVCYRLTVMKHTPRGVLLKIGKRVARDYAHRGRAYAAPTLAQAEEDFRLRKLFQIRRLKSELGWAEQQLALLASEVKLL